MQGSSSHTITSPPRRGMQLDRVVLLGRTLDEYRRYFDLNLESLAGKRILDVAGGVSSFTAEACEQGLSVTAADPIYALSPSDLEPRCEADIKTVFNALKGLKTYKWDFYKSPDRMVELRTRAYTRFLNDFREHGHTRYVPGSLPKVPFEDKEFDLVLVSYFLFVYQDHLSLEFHEQAITELTRVGREVRIYPTVTFEAERSVYLDALRSNPAFEKLEFEEVETDFEFLLNSNNYLKINQLK